MLNIEELLRQNDYPGRGIIFGMTAQRTKAVAVYFIMGRSENSRNRVFIAQGKGIRTAAYNEEKLENPELVIYSPVRVCGNLLIVTNGTQTDAIYDSIWNGEDYKQALETWAFEPDAPIYTPRISGVMDLADGAYRLSIIKAGKTDDPGSIRQYFEYEKPAPGAGHFIHTYTGDANPPESFHGEPREITVACGIEEMTDAVWENLNEQNKVSLFVRYTDLKTKEFETRIINKNR